MINIVLTILAALVFTYITVWIPNRGLKLWENNKRCRDYLDHNVQWCGDGYYCSKCMLGFQATTKSTN